MELKRLIVMRGLPGSGKSTWIKDNHPEAIVACADDFFMVDGRYCYEKFKQGEAHAEAISKAIAAMGNNCPVVVIDATHTRLWEMGIVKTAASALGYDVEIVDLFDAGCTDEELGYRNTHGVPAEYIKIMRERWEKADDS